MRETEKEMSDKTARVKELVSVLNEAARAYYQESREIMDNHEYDALYEELKRLEKDTEMILAGSPTQSAGYEVLSELPKEIHASPMLSLDKTKDIPALQSFLDEQKGILSWKMDGITIVLTYDEGKLVKAVTRGNGEVGEVVTSNARTFSNLPLQILYKGHLVLRGEAVIKYTDFEKLNETIEELDARYKNPRNLCAGSVRQLDSSITASRKVNFIAFALIFAEGVDFHNSCMEQFAWLQEQGFEVVEHYLTDEKKLPKLVEQFAEKVEENDVPSDGLVLLMDDIAYGESLGHTAKFPHNAMAFKWKDELAETGLLYIEWSASRTGLINPVAVFEPVQLEGTTVSRASVHNLSIMEGLQLGEGDRITVYKSNMIIPQIAENLTKSGKVVIPDACPVCGADTQIHENNGVKSLYCINPDCQAKKMKAFELFVSRNALNMEGLSTATLEKFIDRGFIKEFADIFELERWKDSIIGLEGFQQKSYQNMIDSIEKARTTTLPQVIYGLGVPGIGIANAKMLAQAFGFDFERMRQAQLEELVAVDGIGEVLAEAWIAYFAEEKNRKIVDHLLKELNIQIKKNKEEQIYEGKTFVITGKISQFSNRNEMKAYIERRGGKVTGTVTGKTDYLINNDTTSNSSKNKKARELGIPVLSEEDFLEESERKV